MAIFSGLMAAQTVAPHSPENPEVAVPTRRIHTSISAVTVH